MSRWLGTREDQMMAAGLAARIVSLFPYPGRSGFSRDQGVPDPENASHGQPSLPAKAGPTEVIVTTQTGGWVAHIEGRWLMSAYQLARRG